MTTQRWRMVIPISITFMVGLCGFFSILSCTGLLESLTDKPMVLAAQLIMVGMILDGLDGNVARALRGTSDLGANLDTYVDLLVFSVAPAVLFMATSDRAGFGDALVASCWLSSGAFRLARLRVDERGNDRPRFRGLPVTIAASLVALTVVIQDSLGEHPGWVDPIVHAGIALSAVLQVSSFSYPKLTRSWWFYLGVAAMVLCLLGGRPARGTAAAALLTGGMTYALWPLVGSGLALLRPPVRREA